MTVQNYELERLESKRERVRKEVNVLMRHKNYYKDSSLYERVKALTGLETYLTYRIENLTTKINCLTDEDNLV